MASFLHDRASVGICRWHGGLCLLTMVSGSIPGPIYGAFPLHGTVRFGTARYGTVRLSSGRFAFPPQFSTAIEWAGLFTRRYNCAASTAVTSSQTRHKQTHNKERRRNSVLHSRHVDVFNNNGEVYEYENACDLPPAAETVVAVTRAVTLDEESRDVRAGVLRYLIS